MIGYGDQVTNVPKVATQDTILTVNNIDGGKTTFPVPSGMGVDIHVAAVHYTRTLSGFMIGTGSHGFISAVLEGASQVHARAVPWGLAEGRVSSIQSRYVVSIETL